MIELEKRSPSFEMLERIAEALNTDPPELFSKKAYSIEIIKAFHESVLAGFEKVLESRVKEFKDNRN
jgi:transcriptional regulator with XRE-family HTH domain